MDSIIFDIDGTLWDSTDVVAKAWNEVSLAYGARKEAITPADLKGVFGKTLPEIGKILFPTLSSEKQLEVLDQCCEKEDALLREQSGTIFPEIDSVIKELYKHYPLFIVSNCQLGYIETFMHCTGLTPYIKDHLCPGNTGKGKGDNIRIIVERNNLKAPIYVGDTLGDYTATKSAGDIPFVFASYGFGEVDNPDHVISKPVDLLDYCLPK